jgi:excisionase family DNA binding protein
VRHIIPPKAMTYNAIEDRLLTAKEAGDYLGLAEGTVRNKANRNELPFIRLGTSLKSPLRFRRSELDRWITDQQEAPESAA